MRLSDLLSSATSTINRVPPASVAAGVSAAVAFLAALVLLRNTLEGAAAASQTLVTGLGGLIAAFLASRLAAYLVRLAGLWAGWPALRRSRQMAITVVLAIMAAAVVLAIMVLVS